MGSANTSPDILKIYQQLNLSMCSINTVEIPKSCTSLVFMHVYEYCLRHYNMVVIGVYKRRDDAQHKVGEKLNFLKKNGKKKGGASASGAAKFSNSSHPPGKPYVWLHPPKNITLSQNDELFVLSDRNLVDSLKDDEAAGR